MKTERQTLCRRSQHIRDSPEYKEEVTNEKNSGVDAGGTYAGQLRFT